MHPFVRFSLLATTVLAPVPALAGPVDTAVVETATAAEPGAVDGQTVQEEETQSRGDVIVVTARRRTETAQAVPLAISVIRGDSIESTGNFNIVKLQQLAPTLQVYTSNPRNTSVNIRGLGVPFGLTSDGFEQGVGIYVDDVYNSRVAAATFDFLDVQQVEVLRGPQGTLYGKNTLGGAINVITRKPSNELEVRANASYAGPDDAWLAAGSISGPIIKDRLQVRVAYAHRQQDGFIRNTIVNADANPFKADSVAASIRAEPADDVVLTVNGYYDNVLGGAVPYAFMSGPTDYKRTIQLNYDNYQRFKYKRVNAKLEFPLGVADTTVSLIGAYDERNVRTVAGDLDFTAVDIARNTGTDTLRTRTAELRFDSKLSSSVSSIFGLFYSRETRDGDTTTTLFPGVLNIVNRTQSNTSNNTWAAFGNIFWRPNPGWEVSAGLRYDEQKRKATGAVFLSGSPVPIAPANLQERHWSPRIAITRFWNSELMTYASVSRGFRGGGFNSPVAPFRTYQGDSVWTYELGTKYTSADRRVSLSAAVFYNDYKNYIGLNSIAPAITGGFTTVDLNSGDVESYGIELEGYFKPTDAWTISGGISLQHARLTNSDVYTKLTGRTLGSNRLSFQPDWNFNITSDYVVPVGKGDVTFSLGAVGKGDRIAASLNQTFAPVLKSYVLANASVTYRNGGFEIGAFVDNMFDKDYMESYIEKTTLILAGLPASDVGIAGDRRRYGVRVRFKY